MASRAENRVVNLAAVLPLVLVVTFALTTMSAAVAGGVIAVYQVGYGIAAFGMGPLVDSGVTLPDLYGWTAVAAAAMLLISFAITRGRPSPQR